jgi:hypothetical protein
VEAQLTDRARAELATRTLEGTWCRIDALAQVLDRLDREFGAGDRLQVAEAGRHFMRAHYYAEERVGMFKTITAELFFSMVNDLWHCYFAGGDARVVKVGRGYGRLEIHAQPKAALAVSVAMLGLVEEGLKLAGANGVSVRLAQSAAIGDERDVFEATWTG